MNCERCNTETQTFLTNLKGARKYLCPKCYTILTQLYTKVEKGKVVGL
uniref:Uncharacterized protein n=1 Tax=viral metagenome TaxID=1070528 RepID=A0A6M3JHR8_9ZZZZ